MAKKTKADETTPQTTADAQAPEQATEQTQAAEQAAKPAGTQFYSRHPGYRIFDLVQFQDGRAVVSDPALVARLKADPAFGRDFWEEPRG